MRARVALAVLSGSSPEADAAAEQQPVIGRAAVVVEHPVDVRERVVLANQLRDPRGPQRLGRDDIGADRHDACAKRRHELVEVRVAAQRDVARTHAAAACRDGDRITVRQRCHAARLVDAHAGCGGGPRKTQRVVERMQVTASRVEQAAEVTVGRKETAQLVAIEPAQRAVVVLLGELALPALELVDVTRLDRGVDVAVLHVAVDRVTCDALLYEVECLDRDIEHAPAASKRPARRACPGSRRSQRRWLAPLKRPADAVASSSTTDNRAGRCSAVEQPARPPPITQTSAVTSPASAACSGARWAVAA
jgi:hypothetical protein